MTQLSEMTRKTKSIVWISFAVMLLAAGIQRVYPASEIVFKDEGKTTLLGVDAYFHLRHAMEIAHDYPKISRGDNRASFPRGYGDDATGMFGLSIATVARVVGGEDVEMETVAFVAAWSPVILGVLGILLIFLVGNAVAGPVVGLLAMLLFLLYPSTALNRSILGFADHHILEVLLAIWLIWGFTKTMMSCKEDSPLKQWRPALGYAAPVYIVFFSWVGAPLFLISLIVVLTFQFAYLTAKGRSLHTFAQGCFSFFSAFTIGFGLVFLFFPTLIVMPSNTLRWWALFLGVATALAPYAGLLLVERARKTKYSDLMIGLALIAGLVLIGYVVFYMTGIGSYARETILNERTALVREQAEFSMKQIFDRLGMVAYLAFAAFPLSIVIAWKNDKHEPLVWTSLYGMMLTFIWWSANDFDYIAPVALAVPAAFTIFWLVKKIIGFEFTFSTSKKSKPARKKRRKADSKHAPAPPASPKWLKPVKITVATVLSGYLVLGATWPMGNTSPYFSLTKVRQLLVYSEGMFDVMEWLEENTPSPWGRRRGGTYGIFTTWDFGNLVASHANRVPLYSRYPQEQESEFLMARSEEEALDKICPRCDRPNQRVRYVVADVKSAGEFFAAKAIAGGIELGVHRVGTFTDLGDQADVPHVTYGADFDSTMITNLYMNDGQGLQHFRLLYESEEDAFIAYRSTFSTRSDGGTTADVKRASIPLTRWIDAESYRRAANTKVIRTGNAFMYDAAIEPTAKIFQVVEGATFTGNIPKNLQLEIGLVMHSTRDERKIRYRQLVRPDEDGNISVTVPYSTVVDSSRTVIPETPYLISLWNDNGRIRRSTTTIDVSEEDVLRGGLFEITNSRRVLSVQSIEKPDQDTSEESAAEDSD